MADEEALFVVVRVDEPAGDAVGAVAADFASRRVEHVHALHVHAERAVVYVQNLDVGLAEDDEEVTFASGLQLAAHVEVGVHTRLQHGDAAKLAKLAGVRFVVEGAGDEDVEAGIARLTCSLNKVRP